MYRIGFGSLVLLVLFVTVSLPHNSQLAVAQVGAEKAAIGLRAYGPVNRSLLVSLIRNGVIVAQKEGIMADWIGWDNMPVGIYDVRLEGDGLQTLVKRGITLTSTGIGLSPMMKEGQGVKIIEYAATSLTRDEIAARLAKIETLVCRCSK